MRSANGTACSLGLLLVACSSPPPPPPPPYAPLPVVEVARWQVWDGPQLIGQVRHLEIRDPQGVLAYYRIEDLDGRWLGHATENGRFSRRVPFQDQEEDLGVWSMARGVAELLDAKAPVRLQAVAVEADARRKR